MTKSHHERIQERTDEILDESARGDFGQRVCAVTVAALTVALIGTASLIHTPDQSPDIKHQTRA